MHTENLEREHTETLLDVVFGVVIAVALTGLPELVTQMLTKSEIKTLTSVVLLISSLIFSTFYWVEVRHFIAQQTAFDQAIKSEAAAPFDGGVPVPLASFLIGTLLMMTLASAILSYSRQELLNRFLMASMLFWAADFGGALILRRHYARFSQNIESVRQYAPDEHGWFLGHIDSRFFVFYPFVNTFFFCCLWLLVKRIPSSPILELIIAVLVLVLTLFRHLAWRSKIYVWWMAKRRTAQHDGLK